MSFGGAQNPDPDDFFAETRMSFGDHLEDLRLHLWRAIAGFCVGLVFGFFVGHPLMEFISAPVKAELHQYWVRHNAKKTNKVLAELDNGQLDAGAPLVVYIRFGPDVQEKLGIIKPGKAPVLDILPHLQPLFSNLQIEDWVDNTKKFIGSGWIRAEIRDPVKQAAMLQKLQPIVGPDRGLLALNAQEAFLGYFKVSVVAGFVLASPWIFYQIWSFIAAGLYPHEKRYVNVFLPVSIGLFLAGVLLCQFFVIPKAIAALLWFNEWLDLDPEFRFNEWLSFAILMPVVFGISFQTPLVMLFAERIGVVTIDDLRAKRRIAWFVMVLFGAVILPTTDIPSLLFLFVPMCLLYELGILMCVMSPKHPSFDFDETESEELIEV